MLTYKKYAPLFAQNSALPKFNSFPTADARRSLFSSVPKSNPKREELIFKMKIEQTYKLGLREIGMKNKLTNYGILAFLEDIAT